MLRVGLTGGVACGKTTISTIFTALGANILDADIIARQVVAKGSQGLAAIADQFGPSVLTASGALDRHLMRQRIFSDPVARRQLEQIVHPLIRKYMRRATQALQSQCAPYCIQVIPLLLETEQQIHCDRILVVDCSQATQLQRLIARDQSTHSEALAMINSQIARAERLSQADDIIDNSDEKSNAAVRKAVEKLHEQYLRLATGN